MLEIRVDPIDLYHADEDCLMFVNTVVDQVADIRRAQRG